jgi:hypothetical protein
LRHRDLRKTSIGKPLGAALGLPGFRLDEVSATGQENYRPGGQADQRRGSKSYPGSTECLRQLLNVINQHRKLSESEPLTLRSSEFAHAVQELNKAIDRGEGLVTL